MADGHEGLRVTIERVAGSEFPVPWEMAPHSRRGHYEMERVEMAPVSELNDETTRRMDALHALETERSRTQRLGEALDRIALGDVPGDWPTTVEVFAADALADAGEPNSPAEKLGGEGGDATSVSTLETDASAERCPTCNSSAPKMHPAVQSEGEVQPCRDEWHVRGGWEPEPHVKRMWAEADERRGPELRVDSQETAALRRSQARAVEGDERRDHSAARARDLRDLAASYRRADNPVGNPWQDPVAALGKIRAKLGALTGPVGVKHGEWFRAVDLCHDIAATVLDQRAANPPEPLDREALIERLNGRALTLEGSNLHADQEHARLLREAAEAVALSGVVASGPETPDLNQASDDRYVVGRHQNRALLVRRVDGEGGWVPLHELWEHQPSAPLDERGRLLVENLRRASGDLKHILIPGAPLGPAREGLADLLAQAADHIAGGGAWSFPSVASPGAVNAACSHIIENLRPDPRVEGASVEAILALRAALAAAYRVDAHPEPSLPAQALVQLRRCVASALERHAGDDDLIRAKHLVDGLAHLEQEDVETVSRRAFREGARAMDHPYRIAAVNAERERDEALTEAERLREERRDALDKVGHFRRLLTARGGELDRLRASKPLSTDMLRNPPDDLLSAIAQRPEVSRIVLAGTADHLDSQSPPPPAGDNQRLHFALALLSQFEWSWHVRRTQEGSCPTCGSPHFRGHESGCSLESLLTDKRPERLVDLEKDHGDAAFGADGLDLRKHATPIVPPTAPFLRSCPRDVMWLGWRSLDITERIALAGEIHAAFKRTDADPIDPLPMDTALKQVFGDASEVTVTFGPEFNAAHYRCPCGCEVVAPCDDVDHEAHPWECPECLQVRPVRKANEPPAEWSDGSLDDYGRPKADVEEGDDD
jgi:hypothetical protein